MSFDLTRIGFFQFDNLIQNRVPFALLNEPIDFSDLYGPVERIHLERWSIEVSFEDSPEQAIRKLEERRLPREIPVVLLSRSGDRGESWIEKLEALGFKNCCFVTGGWDHLIKESKALF